MAGFVQLKSDSLPGVVSPIGHLSFLDRYLTL
jgi:hypothetical protein